MNDKNDPDVSIDENTKVYFNGKQFMSLIEAIEYERKWPEMPLDLEQFKKFLELRFHEAETNSSINPYFTNRMMYELLKMSLPTFANKNVIIFDK